MLKVVIFDLDDTLISEYEYIKSGYMHIASYLENKGIDEAKNIYNRLISLFDESTKEVFNRLYDYYQVSYQREDILELVREYRNHRPNIRWYDDVLPTLEKLRNKEIKLGMITDGYKVTQRQKIDVLGANELFDKIVVTDDLGQEFWKPNPRAYEMLKQYFDVEWDEIIYIGDNPKKDFYIKQLYPIKTARIVRNKGVYDDESYLEDIKEDIKIKTLNELMEEGLIFKFW